MKFIDQYIKAQPKADWILKNSQLPWLQLQINVPIYEILQEWEAIKNKAVFHRDSDSLYNLKNKGWKSLTLYGVSSSVTTSTNDQPLSWTDAADSCPITVDWIKKNFIINDDTGRIRFMFLEPGGYILPHVDRQNSGLYEINVAITQPLNCYFKFKNYGIIPFTAGRCFIIDTSKEHAVYNKSDEPRLHIILHTKVNEKLLEKSYGDCYHSLD